jgi:hypothetical protein
MPSCFFPRPVWFVLTGLAQAWLIISRSKVWAPGCVSAREKRDKQSFLPQPLSLIHALRTSRFFNSLFGPCVSWEKIGISDSLLQNQSLGAETLKSLKWGSLIIGGRCLSRKPFPSTLLEMSNPRNWIRLCEWSRHWQTPSTESRINDKCSPRFKADRLKAWHLVIIPGKGFEGFGDHTV